MKVKSESEVAHLCLTLSDPIDRSLPGSSILGIFQVRVLESAAIAFSDNYLIKVIKSLPKYQLPFILVSCTHSSCFYLVNSVSAYPYRDLNLGVALTRLLTFEICLLSEFLFQRWKLSSQSKDV